MSAGRNEKVVPGKLLRQHGAQLLDVIRRWRVIFVQADQCVAVLGADRAGVLVGRVDAGKRQTNIVDDVIDLIRRDDLTHCLLDEVE